MRLNLIVRYLPSNGSLTLCHVGRLGSQPLWKPVRWVTEVIIRKPPLNSTGILRQDWPSLLPASHNSVSAVKYSTVKSPKSHPGPGSITWTQMSRHCTLPRAPSLKPTVCVVSLEMKTWWGDPPGQRHTDNLWIIKVFQRNVCASNVDFHMVVGHLCWHNARVHIHNSHIQECLSNLCWRPKGHCLAPVPRDHQQSIFPLLVHHPLLLCWIIQRRLCREALKK